MSKIPLLVVSCDAYSDVWKPFFSVFWKRWPDCPYPVFLGTNHKTYDDSRVTTINVGDDIDWASGVLAMLDQLDCEYFILFLEDFLILQQVETSQVARLLNIAIEEQVGCLRLSAKLPLALPPSRPVDKYPQIGILDSTEPYRVSAQVAIWNAGTIRKLLVPGFTPWEFETFGTQLSQSTQDAFWAVYEPAILYGQFVEKGKWKPEGLEICAQAGVAVDLDKRDSFTQDGLHAHYQSSRLDSENSKIKQSAITKFRIGERMEGLKLAWRYFCRKPFSIQIWGIIFFGMIGHRYIHWLQRQYLQWRIFRIQSRYKHS